MGSETALSKYRSGRCDLEGISEPSVLLAKCEALARFAASNCLGFYADPVLESRLSELAVRALPVAGRRQRFPRQPIRRVLHYVTRTYLVGGHSRLLAHWINVDNTRLHDVVLRLPSELPRILSAALIRCNARCHFLTSAGVSTPLTQAHELNRLACDYDAVVIHAHPDDLVPMLAFSRVSPCPIILNNHSDHSFWIGSSIGCLVISGRLEAVELCVERRGIPGERCFFLPWPLPTVDLATRSIDRSTLRASIGRRSRTEIILSVAHTWKYLSDGGAFFSAFEKFLSSRMDTVLCVAGADHSALGRPRDSNGVLFLGAVENVESLYLSSDLYVDSYPISTGLATLEAFAHGLPILSTDLSQVLPGRPRVDLPGLPRILFHHSSQEEFFLQVERLLDAPDVKQAQRARLHATFSASHSPDSVRQGLESAYSLASELHSSALFNSQRRAGEDIDVQESDRTRFLQTALLRAGLAQKELLASPM